MKLLTGVLSIVAGIAVICILIAFPVMLLWNWLMPEIFGLIEISFWQALGLCFLSSALFKSSSSSK